jgi:hypothetical protein
MSDLWQTDEAIEVIEEIIGIEKFQEYHRRKADEKYARECKRRINWLREQVLGREYRKFASITLDSRWSKREDYDAAVEKLKKIFEKILETGSLKQLGKLAENITRTQSGFLFCWTTKIEELRNIALPCGIPVTGYEESDWNEDFRKRLMERGKALLEEAEHNSILNKLKRALGFQQADGYTKAPVV